MKRPTNIGILLYSSILNHQIVGCILYNLEIFLIQKNLLMTFFLGEKDSIYKKKLINLISKKVRYLFCRSINLSNALEKINTHKILDIQIKKDIFKSTDDSYNLLWSLVFSNSITEKTKSSLKNFIPEDFSIIQSIDALQ